MQRGRIDRAPVWDDVRTLRKEHFRMPIDIITGGFPCQDISVAGAAKGLDGERSGLVFEYLRLIGELRPRFVFMENVPAITLRGLDRVLLGLDALGYDARWTIVSAAEMGAPHLRERWWLLAHTDNGGHGKSIQPLGERRGEAATDTRSYGEVQSVSNSDSLRSRETFGAAGAGRQRISGVHGEKGTASYTSDERCEKWGGGVK